jgi:ATP-dependent DNA helicase RecG
LSAIRPRPTSASARDSARKARAGTPAARSSAYATAISILDRALNNELRRSFDDGAVKGGLDLLIARLVTEKRLPPGTALTRALMDLARVSYGSLPGSGRAQWIKNLRGLLAQQPPAATSRPNPGRSTRPEPKPRPAPSLAAAQTAISLDTSLESLGGSNRVMISKLRLLGVQTLHDLLFHFPHRYDDFSTIRTVSELVPGEQQTLVSTVWSAAEKQMGRSRKGTELIVGDGTGNLRVVFFNQPYLAARFRTGEQIVLSGKVTLFQHQRQMDSPEWESLNGSDLAQALHTGRLVPVYPLTAGLSARSLRRFIRSALDRFLSLIGETLPESLLRRHDLMTLPEAIRQIHYPDSTDGAGAARRRLAFDELLALELAVLDDRRQRLGSSHAVGLRTSAALRQGFLSSLPFPLTSAQRRASEEIEADLELSRPMARLLQGDVGSGKTVVAALSLLATVDNGFQGVLMAPTEILAEQHYRTLCRLVVATANDEAITQVQPAYMPRPLRIGLLHGGLSARLKTASRAALAKGEIDIAVGTQALIQDALQMQRLGLAVVDEQHRFGVLQRAALRDKGRNSHLLVMTATPIPRTLALTFYGDLEISLIDEMPPGRSPAITQFVRAGGRDGAYRSVRQEIDAGRQAFVICPLVEESEKLEVRAAVEEYEALSSLDVFSGVRLGLLHGRMKSKEKDAVMRDFAEHRTQVLVSTAVVEVGIDVPNASVIVIEGADRFGLAQLHQFRGRVGRGKDQSYCFLVAENASPEAGERLRLMEHVQDGFRLAEEDLRLRGPGEYFGTRQSGLPNLRVARLTDIALLEQARTEAVSILDSARTLQAEEWTALRQEVERLRRRGNEVN